jgi:hypothetical protein
MGGAGALAFLLLGAWLALICACIADIWRRDGYTTARRIVWTAVVVLLPFMGTVVYVIVGIFLKDALSEA